MGLFEPNVEKLKAKKNVEELIKLLNHKYSDVQQHATLALCELKDERVVQPLITLLRDPNCNYKRNIVRILGEMRCKAATDDIYKIFKEGAQKYNKWITRVSLSDEAHFINVSWTLADYWETTIALANIVGEKYIDDLNNILMVTAVVLGIGARNGPEIRDFLAQDIATIKYSYDLSRCKDFRERAERIYSNLS